MTEKRFTIDYSDESIINTFTKQYYPTDDISGVEDICDLLNELNDTNKKFGEERWAIMELIIEYDTTDKYSEKDVIDKIKDILGLVMIE